MNTWNDIEHGFGPARAIQYTISDTDQLAADLYKLFHGRYVKSDNGHVITLSDGTSLTIVLADGNASENAGAYNRGIMCAHADRRIIERAHLQKNTDRAGTITGVSLILFYQGETMPATIRRPRGHHHRHLRNPTRQEQAARYHPRSTHTNPNQRMGEQ